MKRLPLYLTILALACLGSCVYPYDSLPESRKERTLVVDGRILIGGISSIQLNYVTPLNAIGGSYPSGDAWIEDDLGNSGVRVIVSEETDNSDSADYLTEIYDFESVIESILKCIQER